MEKEERESKVKLTRHEKMEELPEVSINSNTSHNECGITSNTEIDNSHISLVPISSNHITATHSCELGHYKFLHLKEQQHEQHHYDCHANTSRKRQTVHKSQFMHSVLTAINTSSEQANLMKDECTNVKCVRATEHCREMEHMTSEQIINREKEEQERSEEKEEEHSESYEQNQLLRQANCALYLPLSTSSRPSSVQQLQQQQQQQQQQFLSLQHNSFWVQFAPFYEMAIHEIIVECEKRVANAPLKNQEAQTSYLRGTSNVSLSISTHSFDTPSYLPSMVSTAVYCPSVFTTTISNNCVNNNNINNNNNNNMYANSVSAAGNTNKECNSIVQNPHTLRSYLQVEDRYSPEMEHDKSVNTRFFLPSHNPHESIISLFTALSQIAYPEFDHYTNNNNNNNNDSSSSKSNSNKVGKSTTRHDHAIHFTHFCSPLVLIAGLAYLAKVALKCHCDYASVTWSNWYRLTTTALLIAWKMYKDDANGHSQSHVNAIFAQAANLPLREMNQRELDFLYLVDFDLLLEAREVVTWVDWMERIALRHGLKLSLWSLVASQELHYNNSQVYDSNNSNSNNKFTETVQQSLASTFADGPIDCSHNDVIENEKTQTQHDEKISSINNDSISQLTVTTLPWEKVSNVQSALSFLTATNTTLLPITHRSEITTLCQLWEGISNNDINIVDFNSTTNQTDTNKLNVSHLSSRQAQVESPLTQLSHNIFPRVQTTQKHKERHHKANEEERLFSVVYGWEPPSPTISFADGHAPTLWDLAHAAFLPIPDEEEDNTNDNNVVAKQGSKEDHNSVNNNHHGLIRGNEENKTKEQMFVNSHVSCFYQAHQTQSKSENQNVINDYIASTSFTRPNNIEYTERLGSNNSHINLQNYVPSTHDYIVDHDNIYYTSNNRLHEDHGNIKIDINNESGAANKFSSKPLLKPGKFSLRISNDAHARSVRSSNQQKGNLPSERTSNQNRDINCNSNNSNTQIHQGNPHYHANSNNKSVSVDNNTSNNNNNTSNNTTQRRWVPFGVVQRVREAFDITASLMRGELNVLTRERNYLSDDNNSSSHFTTTSNSSKKNSPASVIETSNTQSSCCRTVTPYSPAERTPESNSEHSYNVDDNDVNVALNEEGSQDYGYHSYYKQEFASELETEELVKEINNNDNNNDKISKNKEKCITHNCIASTFAESNFHTPNYKIDEIDNDECDYSEEHPVCYDDEEEVEEEEDATDTLTENDPQYNEYYEDELNYLHYEDEDDVCEADMLNEMQRNRQQHEHHCDNVNDNDNSDNSKCTNYMYYKHHNNGDEMSHEQFTSRLLSSNATNDSIKPSTHNNYNNGTNIIDNCYDNESDVDSNYNYCTYSSQRPPPMTHSPPSLETNNCC